MTISTFLQNLQQNPLDTSFTDTMAVIDAHYDFTETEFKNGETLNPAGQNSGSCKLFAFAQLNDLDVDSTLACFGDYYRKDVLENPTGTDHANIRNFIQHGWAGISFKGTALVAK